MRTETSSRKHVLTGYANKFLACAKCKQPVLYWHNPDRCPCDDPAFNSPCEHTASVVSMCPTWSSVAGCNCSTQDEHSK
jgi:hypothetical protein